jgi:hypothetical protein
MLMGVAMKGRGVWQVCSRTTWEVICRRCGRAATWAEDADEAVDAAKEQGWMEGFCPDCWDVELERLEDRLRRHEGDYEIPLTEQRTW